MSVQCYYCAVSLVKSTPADRRFTWDHKIPKSRGGTNAQANLVPACWKCNQEKGQLNEDEFMTVLKMREKLTSVIPSRKPPEITLEDLKFLYEVGTGI